VPPQPEKIAIAAKIVEALGALGKGAQLPMWIVGLMFFGVRAG
jgi:hypothetical protein